MGHDTLQFDEEVFEILGIRLECNAWHGVGLDGLGLFDDAWAGAFHFVDIQ